MTPTSPPGVPRRPFRRSRTPLLLLFAGLAALPAAQPARAQTGRAQITVLEYEGSVCRQAAARTGRASRGWYCFRGVVRHPAGVAEVLVQGEPAALRTDETGATVFTALPEMKDEGGDIAVVVRASNGETSEGAYRLTPAAPNPAYPDLRQFSLTNLRPRLLGAGDDRYVPPPPSGVAVSAPPTAAQAAAAQAAGPLASAAPAPAAGTGGAGTGTTGTGTATTGTARTDSTGVVGAVAAAPAFIEDPASRYIQISEPREWSGVGTRGITVPGRRSVRVTGYASHPEGVESVLVDGRSAAIRQENGGSYRFVGYVPADSVSREVVVMVRGRTGNPVIGRYQLNATPAAQSFASRDEPWSAQAGFRGRRWAVVVGISAYQDTAIKALQYADDDARAIYDFLRSPAAGGGGFAQENVKLLLNEQATYAEVRAALYSYLRQATDEDQVFIYFAGHGAPDPARLSDLYLLTYDTRADQVPATGFPMRDLDRAVGELYARHVVLITDACHSGGITTQFASRGGDNTINDIFLQQLSSTTGGLAVFTASGAAQLSLEDARWGGGHGVFTHYLLEALRGAADDDGDQIVTLSEMMHYTVERVRRETQNSQIPSIGDRTYDQYLPMSIVLDPREIAAHQAVAQAPGAAAPGAAAAAPGAPKLSPALADSLARAREAVTLFPSSAQYRSRLARVLLRAEMRDEALQTFREAVRLDGESAEFHADLAMALRDGGEAEAALPHFADALRLDAQNGRYQHEYGAALLMLNRMDEALGAYRRAVRLDAGNPAYHASLGEALRLSGRTRDAVASLRTAVQLDGETPVYHRELAVALAGDGQAAEAIQEMQGAIRADSLNAAYHMDLAGLLNGMGDGAAARAAMGRAVRLDSANAAYRSELAALLEATGMQYEAILELRTAVRLDSANARYRYQHGMLLTRSNQADNALAELRAAVRLAPEEASYRNGLGQALRASGRPADAVAELIQATRLEPENAQFQYDLALFYTEAGQHGDALAALEQAARLAPDNREYAVALRDARRRAPR
ncbi:MAG TPA: caspase family protein [Longimicrobium sp.]|jgi:Flp pilus assembly protein TadD|uniref:tetratricopeptide repeat protein n=1 Tax=Longimicrobium sp. TaxID=2029185 RepID=UPI002EDB4AC7